MARQPPLHPLPGLLGFTSSLSTQPFTPNLALLLIQGPTLLGPFLRPSVKTDQTILYSPLQVCGYCYLPRIYVVQVLAFQV